MFVPFVSNSRELVLPNGLTHSIRHGVTCPTVGVVYLAQCRCGSYYIGKTKRPFQVRIRDHIKPLPKNTTTTAINWHIATQHNSDPHVIQFSALQHVPPHARGGSIDNTLLQLETKWIHTLQATKFPGLNEHISFKPFLWVWISFRLSLSVLLSLSMNIAAICSLLIQVISSSFLTLFLPSFPFSPSPFCLFFLLPLFLCWLTPFSCHGLILCPSYTVLVILPQNKQRLVYLFLLTFSIDV